jgi:hypothetical protein
MVALQIFFMKQGNQQICVWINHLCPKKQINTHKLCLGSGFVLKETVTFVHGSKHWFKQI